MTKRLGDDFKALQQEAMAIPEVREYLQSFSVIIGDIVYARRMQLNLSQKELAEKADTIQARISMIEKASGNVSQDVLDRVFRVLQLQDIHVSFNEEAATLAN
ncbi:helix-turn-helix domain-containing protein [Bacillus sp. FJAT-28004]|uniref:helix-turn-helix domain-containing protein n=1 Tax=Bacillus sp. FJAT-28004 TaxID=1679165 RepID=UPI0006B4A078|nr:helix-turn-helix transcriptional regulator [Bacillus sp. FJAT-28004]